MKKFVGEKALIVGARGRMGSAVAFTELVFKFNS